MQDYTNRANITIGEKLLHIGAAPIVTNRGNSYNKPGQFQLLQIGAKLLQIEAFITSWNRIITNRAGITNWGNYYKSV